MYVFIVSAVDGSGHLSPVAVFQFLAAARREAAIRNQPVDPGVDPWPAASATSPCVVHALPLDAEPL